MATVNEANESDPDPAADVTFIGKMRVSNARCCGEDKWGAD